MSIESSSQFKKQIPKNAVLAVVSSATYILSAIWLTPYLIKHLGSAAYGLVPLAALFTQYASLITTEISSSVGRFLTIEIQRPKGNPNRTFNSAFALYLVLILIQLPLFAAGIFYSDRLFNIPEGLRMDALLLLAFSAGTFLVSLLGAVFGVSLFASNRLDIGNAMLITRLIARLVLIVAFFSIKGPGLRYIGYVDFVLQVASFCVGIYFWKKLTPHLHLSYREVDRRELKPIFKMSFWSLINRFGSLLYGRSDLWIINRFISPVLAGKYAAILVISHLIPQLAAQVTGQLMPTIMNCWAKGEENNLRRLLLFTIKVLVFGLTVLAGLLCVHGKTVLRVWLGDDFIPLFLLLVIFVIHQPINGSTQPLLGLNKASNSVRLPALISMVLGMLNLAASYYFGVVLGKGVIGVALVTAVVVTLKNSIFTPLYASYILKLSRRVFILPLIGSLSMYGLVYVLTLIPLARWLGLKEEGIPILLIEGIFVSLICGILCWRFIITAAEKNTVVGMLPERVRNVLERFAWRLS